MATFRRVGDKWRAEVCVNGKRRSKRFAAPSAKGKRPPFEAVEWAENIERELSALPGDIAHGYTLRDAMRRYSEEVTPEHKGQRWEVVRLGKLDRDKIADVSLAQLSVVDLEDWRDRSLERISGASVAREMTLLMSVARSAVEWKWCPKYPFEGAKRPKGARPRKRRVTQAEIELLCIHSGMTFEQLQSRTKAQRTIVMALVAIESGMRMSELTGLTWDRVKLSERWVYLPETKNGDERYVPLSTRAVELVELLERGSGPVFGVDSASASTFFRRVRDSAGIKDLHFHDTRHEACSRLARKVDVLDLARIIGHRDINSLMIYYNPTAAELAARLG